MIDERPHGVERLLVVLGLVVDHAGDFGVRHRAPQLLRLHVLPDRRLHEVRPRQKHRAGPLHDDRLVAHNRQVRPTRHATPHDGRDLRDALARQPGIVAENAPEVLLVWKNLVLKRQVHPRRVHEVQNRHVVLQRNLLRPQVLLRGNGKPGARLHGGVVGHDHTGAALDRPQAHHRAARRAPALVLVHLVARKQAEFFKLPRIVHKVLHPFAGRQLAALMLSLDALFTAPLPHFGGALLHLFNQGLVVRGSLLKCSVGGVGLGPKWLGVGHKRSGSLGG